MPETHHLRPRAHFTTASTWLNDPNGLVLVDGTYHLFFQTNPDGAVWGTMSWGHATSQDLITWVEQPVALRHNGSEAIYSGSVVVDHDNTSGFGEPSDDAPTLVAVYTSHYEPHAPRGGTEAQSLAWSRDGGTTWTTYPDNPVLDRGSSDFRDPKVFWHRPTASWVMVAVEALERQVVVYRSWDLRTWEHASTFGPAGSTEGVWECPDLFEVPVAGTDGTAWVLVASVGAGGPAGGSGTQWWVGSFDGVTFAPAGAGPPPVRWLDHGPDHYAAVSFDNTPGRRLMVGWAGNWAYATDVPTSPWVGVMSLAREVDLVRTSEGPALRQRPVLPAHADVARHTRAVPAEGVATLTLTTDEGRDPLVVTVDAAAGVLVLDRSRCGDQLGGPFSGVATAPLVAQAPAGPTVDVLVVVDGCVVEVYAQGGLVTLTAQVFPSAPLTSATWT